MFVLCVEVLGIMIRQNKLIKGIIVQGTEHKMTQYADDTELMLEGNRTSFEEAVNTVQRFGQKFGLYLNAGKTMQCHMAWKQAKFTCEVHATLAYRL